MAEEEVVVPEAPEKTRSKVIELPDGHRKDKPDDQRSRWNRDRHLGLQVGQFINAPPMFFNEDMKEYGGLIDTYRGRSAFLIASGPSFKEIDTSKLASCPAVTMGMNNSPRTFRPNLWCSVDSPSSFIRSIWLDPRIMKFVPICHTNKRLFHSDAWKWMDMTVGECPNMVYYRRNEKFIAKQYLTEDTINWGCHKDYGGGRSVMLAAIRILYLLGFRSVFLLGCDFKMDVNAPANYHFDQHRHKSSVNGNNSTYQKLNQRFAELQPYFRKENFSVYNCNLNSGLKAFDFVTFDDAVAAVNSEWGNVRLRRERTAGLYDQEKPPEKDKSNWITL